MLANEQKKSTASAELTNKPPFEEKLDIHSTISYPKRGNNKIETFMEGNDFYSTLQKRCKSAKHSIWCAISFGSWSFQFPNGKHWWEYFQILKQNNPLLIIRVLFWRNIDKRWQSNGVIMGVERDNTFIQKNKLNQNNLFQFKWDESPNPSHCHHGKYFIIDAEKNNNLQNIYCFVGGMTLNKIVYSNNRHDTVIQINGPSCIDIINNYKLRWNHNNIFNKCITMETFKPFLTNIDDFKYDITDQKEEQGVFTQVCMTMYPKLYPGYDCGESGIHYQYYKAFLNAKKCIYIESQHPGDWHLLRIMKWKLESDKKFKIIFVVPINMMHPIIKAKRESLEYILKCKELKDNNNILKEPRYHKMFSTLSSLKQFDNFCLCGMYKSSKVGKNIWYESIYVHSKLSVVDGKWFTIGSANFVDISFINDHSELNVCVFDEKESIKLMRALACKHCEKKGKMFKKMNHLNIVEYMIQTARENVKHKESKNILNGRLCALDPELYAS
eukprot:298079_1